MSRCTCEVDLLQIEIFTSDNRWLKESALSTRTRPCLTAHAMRNGYKSRVDSAEKMLHFPSRCCRYYMRPGCNAASTVEWHASRKHSPDSWAHSVQEGGACVSSGVSRGSRRCRLIRACRSSRMGAGLLWVRANSGHNCRVRIAKIASPGGFQGLLSHVGERGRRDRQESRRSSVPERKVLYMPAAMQEPGLFSVVLADRTPELAYCCWVKTQVEDRHIEASLINSAHRTWKAGKYSGH
jgi:hypothetical protein